MILELIRHFIESDHVQVSAESPLDTPLTCFLAADCRGRKLQIPLNTRDAMPGILILGKSGSGKTSGPGRQIADALLKRGLGGLVLTVKTEEADEWESWAAAAGRHHDLVRITPEGPYQINLLQFEAQQPGATTEGLVELLMLLAEAASGNERRQDEWQDFVRTYLRNAVDLVRFSGHELRPRTLLEFSTDPKLWEQFYRSAKDAELTASQADDLDICAQYFGRQWPGMAPETRSSIETNLVSLLDSLSRGTLRDLLATQTTISPEATFDGKIIIVDLPTKKYQRLGRLANVAWKSVWQRAVERRGSKGASQPAFLWADECQQIITSKDAEFALTARSAGGIMVFLTQAISGLWHAFGGPEKGKAPTEILLGNLPTKIFCQNDDRETNKWTQELLGRKLQFRGSSNTGFNFANAGGGGSGGTGQTETMDFVIETNRLLGLSSGGPANNRIVTALLYMGRELPPDSEFFTEVAFRQI